MSHNFGLKQSIVDPAAIFRQAIMQNSDSVLLLHNHPSSSVEPSLIDDELTKRITEAGRLMGVPVLDHVIVGGYTGQIYSYREESPDAAMLFQDGQNLYAVSEYKEQQKQSRQERIKEIMSELDRGVETFFTSEKYQRFLNTMQKFHNYSFQNTLLIALQRPDATRVASYDTWKKLGRQVQKGERGIKVIVPAPVKIKKDSESEDTGMEKENEQEQTIMRFKIGHVFDLAQTRGEPLPELEVPELTGDVMDFERMLSAIETVSDVPISFEEISSGAKGYYNDKEKRIAIQSGMSEQQTIKTGIHELAHSIIHNQTALETVGIKDRQTKEVEAESVAFSVCSYLGLDTSDYSFPYISSWSSSHSLRELRQSMDTIRETTQDILSDLEKELEKSRLPEQEIEKENELKAEQFNKEMEKENYTGQTVRIYQLRDTAKEIMFAGIKELKAMGRFVRAEDYGRVYSYTEKNPDLDRIYEKFNVRRPSDFEGHSLSVSDLIVIGDGEDAKAYYVDSFGFAEVPDVAAELTLQDDAHQLTVDLDTLAYEHDYYSYRDTVDDRVVQVQGVAESILDGDVDDIHKWLAEIIDDDRVPEDVRTARELEARLQSLENRIQKESTHEKHRAV